MDGKIATVAAKRGRKRAGTATGTTPEARRGRKRPGPRTESSDQRAKYPAMVAKPPANPLERGVSDKALNQVEFTFSAGSGSSITSQAEVGQCPAPLANKSSVDEKGRFIPPAEKPRMEKKRDFSHSSPPRKKVILAVDDSHLYEDEEIAALLNFNPDYDVSF